MLNKYVISALVYNQSGVLLRIAGLFSRRGYNIDSLNVCETDDPKLSRMTIVVKGDSAVLEQIMRQLDKQEDVVKVIHLLDEKSIVRELLLIKVRATPEQRGVIIQAANVYNAQILDLATESVTIETTGESSALNAFIDLMRPYGILELIRSGLTALERGNNYIMEEKQNG